MMNRHNELNQSGRTSRIYAKTFKIHLALRDQIAANFRTFIHEVVSKFISRPIRFGDIRERLIQSTDIREYAFVWIRVLIL